MKKTVSILAFLLTFSCTASTSPEVQKSVLAGRWYPADRNELSRAIDGLILKKDAVKSPVKPVLIIVPHAGYTYSGPVAAAGFNTIKRLNPDLIIIIAPSHYSRFHGCAVLSADYYETPLGRLKIEKDIAKSLLKNKLFITNSFAYQEEHSAEIEIPFIQRIFGDSINEKLPVLIIMAGEINKQDAVEAAGAITQAIAGKKYPLFIISSDFTHYGERFGYLPFLAKNNNALKEKLRELDTGAINLILKKDTGGFLDYCNRTGITICGKNPIIIALSLPIKNFKAQLISYDTSGNITGDFLNSVSYAAIAAEGTLTLIEKNAGVSPDLSREEKKFLLELARKNIESHLFKNKEASVNESMVPGTCKKEMGVFVTLKKRGELRGCIGYIQPVNPLYRAVLDNSYNAAFSDPRFPELSRDEFKDVTIEISVLTVPAPVKSADEIVVGRDGLIIEQGLNKGILLPQVPVEWGWNKEEFLRQTCHKAGLPDYAWRDGAKIYKFQAIVFSENER